jgi:hypothetical protein
MISIEIEIVDDKKGVRVDEKEVEGIEGKF